MCILRPSLGEEGGDIRIIVGRISASDCTKIFSLDVPKFQDSVFIHSASVLVSIIEARFNTLSILYLFNSFIFACLNILLR